MAYEMKNGKVCKWEGTKYCGQWINFLSFDSKKEAEEYLLNSNCEKSYYRTSQKAYFYPTGTYYLKHGEYERPDYVIRKFRGIDKYGIYVTHYYYSGTYNVPSDGFMTTY